MSTKYYKQKFYEDFQYIYNEEDIIIEHGLPALEKSIDFLLDNKIPHRVVQYSYDYCKKVLIEAKDYIQQAYEIEPITLAKESIIEYLIYASLLYNYIEYIKNNVPYTHSNIMRYSMEGFIVCEARDFDKNFIKNLHWLLDNMNKTAEEGDNVACPLHNNLNCIYDNCKVIKECLLLLRATDSYI